MSIKRVLLSFFVVIALVSCGSKTYTPSNLTNNDWVNGVAKGWGPAFFISNTSDAQTNFVVGKKIVFANGETRVVTKTQINDKDLIVFVDGAQLDGNTVGYPKEISFVE